MSVKVDCLNEDKVGAFIPFKLKLAELGIIAAQCLATCKESFIPVRFLNLKEKEVTLNKNTIIGHFEIFCDNNSEKNDINVIESSTEYKNICNEIIKKIYNLNELNISEKEKAVELLNNYANVFALNKHDYGLCTKLKHEIYIKANAPVQQIFGQVPINVECWVDEQI